jgi:hypothetical protein
VHYPFTCDNAPAVRISLCTVFCFLRIVVNATCLLFEASKHEGVVRDQTSRTLSLLPVCSGPCFVTKQCAGVSVCDRGILFGKGKKDVY